MNGEKELEFAKRIAQEAGQEILSLARGRPTISYKAGHEVVTSVDRTVEAVLRYNIAQTFPYDGILSEETEDTPHRFGKRRVWIVDPLDGTKEFVKYFQDPDKHPYFAVHVGLVVDGVPYLGVVAWPLAEQTYYAQKGHGAFVEKYGTKQRLHVSNTASLSSAIIGVASPEKHNAIALANDLGVTAISYQESTGLRICSVAAGLSDCTFNMNGNTREWDICAPHVILEEAGGKISTARTPLLYNQPDVSIKSVVATNGLLHAEIYKKFHNV